MSNLSKELIKVCVEYLYVRVNDGWVDEIEYLCSVLHCTESELKESFNQVNQLLK